MKNIFNLKNTFAVCAVTTAFMLVVGVGAASAEISLGGENHLTGPNSENENELDIDNDLDIDVENDTDVDNDFDFEVETGQNWVGNNTWVDDFSTGDIEVDFEIVNETNGAEFEIADFGMNDYDFDFANDTTGPNSENSNEVNINNDADIDIDNEADFDNDIDLYANTGRNEIDCNTQVGDVRTGDIEINADIENSTNMNMGGIDLSGISNFDVDADLSNELTGPCSENENELNIDNDFDLDIKNKADFDNDIDVYANTGQNQISGNTVVGDVETGDIQIDLSVTNVAN